MSCFLHALKIAGSERPILRNRKAYLRLKSPARRIHVEVHRERADNGREGLVSPASMESALQLRFLRAQFTVVVDATKGKGCILPVSTRPE